MGSKRTTRLNDKKAIVVSLIKEKRHILFGRCSETLTHQLKTDTWLSIYEKGCSMGILDPSKGWRYLRDTVWQNWKKVSLSKAKNKKEFRALSKRSKLNEIDKTVLEILSSEGYVSSSKRLTKPTDEELVENMKSDTPPEVVLPIEIELDPHDVCKTPTTQRKTKKSRQESTPLTREEVELKLLKTKLDLMKRDVYMKDIEIYKKEKEFGLPISEFTQKFYNDDVNNSEVGSSLLSDSRFSESFDIECKVEDVQ